MKRNIAIVGCGGFARNHVIELSKRDDIYISAFVDPVEKNRKNLSGLYKSITGSDSSEFGSITQLMRKATLFDAVIVVAPPKTHYEITKDLLKLKKSVYVEKPFTEKVSDAIKLCRISKENNTEISIGTNRSVFPAYRAAANAFKEGQIGKLLGILFYYRHQWEKNTVNNWRQNPNERSSGILADHSPHFNHYLFTDLKFKPINVTNMGSRFNSEGVDIDTWYCLTNAANINAYIILNGSSNDNIRREVINIYGEFGQISIEFTNVLSETYLIKNGIKTIISKDNAIKEINALGIKDPYSHPALIHNFASLILGKTKVNANPGKEGILPVHVTELLLSGKGKTAPKLNAEELREMLDMIKMSNEIPLHYLDKHKYLQNIKYLDKEILDAYTSV